MDVTARSNKSHRNGLFAVVLAASIGLSGLAAIFAYRYYGGTTANGTETTEAASSSGSMTYASSSTIASSSTGTISTISISNSTGLGSLVIAQGESRYPFDYPTLDPNTGLVYLLTSTTNGTNTLLVVFNATSSTYQPVRPIPGTGIGIAIDPILNEIYVVTIADCGTVASAASTCPPNGKVPFGPEMLRVNGTTGALDGLMQIPWPSGIGVGLGEFPLGVNSKTHMLFLPQQCPVDNASFPCENLLELDPETGSLIGNLTVKAQSYSLAVDSSTNVVYLLAVRSVKSPDSSEASAESIIAVNASNFAVKFESTLNFTSTNGLALDEDTNILYGLADDMTSATLFAMSASSGAMLFSAVVGDSCAVTGGPWINTSTDQIYLEAGIGPSQVRFMVIVDGATGKVVGMLPSSPVGIVGLDPGLDEMYVVYSDPANVLTIAVIPSAVLEGNIDPAILNATCPPPPLPEAVSAPR